MQDIKIEELESVTGGTAQQAGTGIVTPTHTGSTASTGCGNDQLLTSLNSISSSIKDLSNKNNQGLFGGNGLLFLGMALALRGRSDNTVYVNGGGGCCHSGGSFSWHARW